MKQDLKDYFKVKKVIESCKTLEQLEMAERMFELWKEYHNIIMWKSNEAVSLDGILFRKELELS